MELSVLGARQSAHVSYLSGFALNNAGREQAAMGIAVGGYNRDEKVDFCITNFSDDYDTVHRNDGGASFTDVSYAAGIANATTPFFGWGTSFLDYDNDGFLDPFFAMGKSIPKWTSRTGHNLGATPGVVSEPEWVEVRAGGSGYGQLDAVQSKRLTSLESVR
jgi:hypothetical protein